MTTPTPRIPLNEPQTNWECGATELGGYVCGRPMGHKGMHRRRTPANTPGTHGPNDGCGELLWQHMAVDPSFNEELRQAEADLAEGRGVPFRAIEREAQAIPPVERCHCGHLNASCDRPDHLASESSTADQWELPPEVLNAEYEWDTSTAAIRDFTECPSCDGEGEMNAETCPVCNGRGIIGSALPVKEGACDEFAPATTRSVCRNCGETRDVHAVKEGEPE